MPNIKPEILTWARETAELSLGQASAKLNIRDSSKASAIEKLAAYERGASIPSRSLLLRMANQYRRPLLTFYLERPPQIGDRGEDFRTLPERIESEQNVYVDALIRDIKARQRTIRETLIDEDEGEILSFVGSCNISMGNVRVSVVLGDILELDIANFRGQSSIEQSFSHLRNKVEEAGIFVLLIGNLGSYHSNIDVTAFRGFAISDDIAPFIVINDRDAKAAWSFTLLHEMVHLLLGQTGISGGHAEKQVEKFCNDVASDFLLPETDFAAFTPDIGNFEYLAEDISTFSFQHKVSSSHVAYKLYKRGDVDKNTWSKLRDFFHKQWRAQREKIRARSSKQDGGPDYYVVKRHKLGSLVRLVQRFTSSGALSTTKAGMLLGVKTLKVYRLFNSNLQV